MASASPKPDLIAYVAVGSMNVHGGAALEPALSDTETWGIKPRIMLGDSHYGSEENLEEASTHGVEVIAPAMPAKGSKQSKITLEDFDLDERGHVVRCPGGQTPLTTSEGEERVQALFAPATCAACPLRAACPASAVGRKERRFQYTRDRVRHRERRLGERTEAFRDRYRWRSGIELFFKWVKQNLQIKFFYGTSDNAVRTQVWIAISGYVLVAIIKKEQNHHSLTR